MNDKIYVYIQGPEICALCLLVLVHVKGISQNGSTTQHQQDVNSLFMVDVKEMIIDLILERAVRVPVYVVSFIHIMINYVECR